MENYFSNIPNLLYPSLDPEKNSLFDYDEVKNFFRRFYIREDFLQDITFFNKYTILDNERPDNVAEKVYSDPLLDWVILITNNIIDVYNEWPLNDENFYSIINQKYPNKSYTDIAYYETLEIKDVNNRVILPKGMKVSSNFKIKDPNNPLTHINPVRGVSYVDMEKSKNDKKRNILILKPRYFSDFKVDLKKIRYRESKEYINRNPKQTAKIF